MNDFFGPGVFDFEGRLALSEGIEKTHDLKKILLENIPGAIEIIKASSIEDINGTDYWVVLENGQKISIDKKIRNEDWSVKEKGSQDDLALETWSNVERSKIGWTRDQKKRTDYIIWVWKDTGRWCLIPFRMLCQIFEEKWQEWGTIYKISRQTTPVPGDGCYQSECIFVPRRLVWAEIYKRYGGRLRKV